MDDSHWMQQAIAIARQGIQAGQTPFGAALVRQNQLIVATHNTVWRDTDPTAHAEINLLRQGARLLGTIDLSGCQLFTTCEPCPMCLAASHWAKIQRVVYGASIEDAAAAGFKELFLPARDMVERGRSPLHVDSDCLREECRALFSLWSQTALSRSY